MERRHFASILIILAVGVIAYANSFSGEFVWDAGTLIQSNVYIRHFSLSNIRHIFTSPFFGEGAGFDFYRPLSMLSFMLDYSLWKLNPFGYHLTNFILHYLNACLIYMILYLCFGRRLIALFLGLFFIAHPSATEAITYIASRSDPLALLFLVLSLVFFERYHILSLASFALACFAKETAVAFPAFLLVYAMLADSRKQEDSRRHLAAVIPYGLIAGAYLFIRQMVLRAGGNLFFEKPDVGFAARIISSPAILMRYIGTFILPRRFVIEEPVTLFNSLANPVALLSAIFILAAVILIIRFRLPKIALGAAWFAAFIFPVCGIIAVNSFFYNHWLYIPSLGLLAVSAGILSFGVRKLSAARWGRAARYLIGCAGAVYLAMLCTLTIQQNRYWSNAITMGEKTLEAAPDSARVNYALGNAYNEAGRYQEAASFLKKAIEIDPKNPTPYILLGNSYYGLGEFNKAIAQYMKARELGPAPVKVEMCNNVANCHVALGDTDKAIEWFNKAVAEKPDLPYLYYNLGLIYMGKSENKRAAELFTKALKVDPAMKETYVNLALIYNNEGEPQKAIEQLKKAIEVDPEYQKAYNNLSALYAAINQHDLAAQYREKADRLNRK